MYGIFTYIGVVLGVNVGIYGIHGVSGYGMLSLGMLLFMLLSLMLLVVVLSWRNAGQIWTNMSTEHFTQGLFGRLCDSKGDQLYVFNIV